MTQIDYDQKERERSDLICYPQSKAKIYDDRTQDGLWLQLNFFTLFIEVDKNSHPV